MSSMDQSLSRTVSDILNLSSMSENNNNNNNANVPTPQTSPADYLSEVLLAAANVCQNCVLNNQAHSKCETCNENLCDTCVAAHKQVDETKDHQIKKIPKVSETSNVTEDSGVSELTYVPSQSPNGTCQNGTYVTSLGSNGTYVPSHSSSGAYGQSQNLSGSYGQSNGSSGIYGQSNGSSGTYGQSRSSNGTYVQSHSSPSGTYMHQQSSGSIGGCMQSHSPSGSYVQSQSPPYGAYAPSQNSMIYNEESSTVVPSCSGLTQNSNIMLTSQVTQLLNSVSLSSSGGQLRPPRVSSTGGGSPPNEPPRGLCPKHNSSFRAFCTTCFIPVCVGCSTYEHQEHQMTPLVKGFESALQFSARLTEETRRAMLTIRESLDNVQRMKESVEMNAYTTAAEVREAMRKCIAAFEAHEMSLLCRINQGRQVKLGLLDSQMENLRIAYARLAKVTDSLSECSKTVGPVTYDLLTANGQAFKELKEFKGLGVALSPCEDDGFYFLPPPDRLETAISNCGRLYISSSTLPQGNRNMPALLGRENGNVARYKDHQEQSFLPSFVSELNPALAKGRPIYGVSHPVVVRDMGPNPSLIFGAGANNGGAGGTGEDRQVFGKVNRPWGIAVNRHGQYIVGDRSNHQIQVFDSSGRFVFKFGAHGSALGQFNLPAGVAVNPQDDIVVADKDNHRIQVFNREGKFLFTFGECGKEIGQFAYPWDVACDSKGNIVVSDTRNHRIQLFTWNGTFIAKYGCEGNQNVFRHFDQPRGVCFHPSGDIIVTDFNNHRVVILDFSLTKARYLGDKCELGGIGKFFRPQGVTCDDRGNIVVADGKNHRIQVFNDKGDFLWSMGQMGTRPGFLDVPSGVCLTVEGRISVVDFNNNRIQTF